MQSNPAPFANVLRLIASLPRLLRGLDSLDGRIGPHDTRKPHLSPKLDVGYVAKRLYRVNGGCIMKPSRDMRVIRVISIRGKLLWPLPSSDRQVPSSWQVPSSSSSPIESRLDHIKAANLTPDVLNPVSGKTARVIY
jgi:hypothetical protein